MKIRRRDSWVALTAGLLWAGLAQVATPQTVAATQPTNPQAAPTEAATPQTPPQEAPGLSKQVRQELAALPYYGVFDLFTFHVNHDGTVVLGGEVVNGTLKHDAERAVKRIPGVTGVEDKIEVLPTSTSDDDVRWAEYRAIYFDPPLVRYGTPWSQWAALRPRLWGWGWGYRNWSVFGESRWAGPPFYGMEPVGNYAIHIIVKNGNVTLAGVVDDAADKDIAGLQANAVPGAFSVTNDLQFPPPAEGATTTPRVKKG